jgi:SAM-dependent methyltransferase
VGSHDHRNHGSLDTQFCAVEAIAKRSRPPVTEQMLDHRSGRRLESVWFGRDPELLEAMFDFYAPDAQRIVDVCCHLRKMWGRWSVTAVGYDIDPGVRPDRVGHWGALPDANESVDVLLYDPPHLPLAAASRSSLPSFVRRYGLTWSVRASNIGDLHRPFLLEARRVLRPDGLLFAKLKDYVHNHRYQWNLELFNTQARGIGLTPCDLIVKRDPAARTLNSGRWSSTYHARNVHCFWVVVRNGRCEPKARHSVCETPKRRLGGDVR